jgi:hypothetical protein
MESEPFVCAVASLIRKVEEVGENCWNYDTTYDRTRNCESLESRSFAAVAQLSRVALIRRQQSR